MVHRGKEFGVDLYELERVAKVDFPVISADYGDAIGDCDRVRSEVAEVMRRSDHFDGDTLGPVYHEFLGLHDAVTGLLRETRTSLDDMAATLVKAAQGYAATDQAAKSELYRRAQGDPELRDKI